MIEYDLDFEAQLRTLYGKDVVLDKRYGKKKTPTIDFSSFLGIMRFYTQLLQPPPRPKAGKNAIGVVYLEGMILPGESDGSPFGSSGMAYSTTIRKALDKAAKDDSIKAVVFRINSGGNSDGSLLRISVCSLKTVAQRKTHDGHL